MNRTDVAPERFVPVIATLTPAQPLPGSNAEMLGEPEPEPETVKSLELVAVPLGFVTVMRPVVAVEGTIAVIWLGELTTYVAGVPLNRTDVAPTKFAPVMTTVVPLDPLLGVKVAMVGQPVGTVKVDGLVAVPLGVTTDTGPVVAPPGTTAEIRFGDSIVNVADAPLNRTDVAEERFEPLIVTETPGQPLVGFSDVTAGAPEAVMVNDDELVAWPEEVIIETGPVEAPLGTVAVTWESELMVKSFAVTPLKRTDVVPPKPVPVITTEVPTGPLVGLNDAIAGHPAVCTVKVEALLAVPSGVVTEIGPLLAPDGTLATSSVLLLRVNAATTPLNLTLLTLLNPEPEIVMSAPIQALEGLNESTVGAGAARTGDATPITSNAAATTETIRVI